MADTQALSIIYVPSDIGSMIKGKSLAPEAFRQAGFVSKLESAGFKVSEKDALTDGPRTWSFGSSFEPNGVRNEEANIEVKHRVKRAVSEELSGSNSPSPPFQIIVGGGCEIAPAIMSALWAGLEPARVGLVYVDADADLTKPEDPGSSGNIASMTFTHLAMVPGSLESMRPFTRPDGSGVVDPSNAVIFGLNAGFQGNTRSQMGYLMDEGYRVFTSAAVAKDPELRAKQALQYLEERVDHILVHLDVDAIDATSFPLANIPNRTGAGFDQVLAAMQVFLRSKKVCGLVLAEVNPDHDPDLIMTKKLIDRLVDGLKGRL
jgi:arginase family enzyme